MKLIYFCVIFNVILISCQNKSGEKKENYLAETEKTKIKKETSFLFNINLDKEIQNAEEAQIPLSTFLKDIEYIPLQTTSKSLIGGGRHGIQQYLVTDKVIVADMKIFSRSDGHYIGNLLKKGQGPEDYLYIMEMDADDEREEFYLYDSSRLCIHIVGYDNTYKGQVKDCGDYANVFSLGNGIILIPNYCYLNDRNDVFFIKNVETKDMICKWISPALRSVSNFEDCKRVGRMGSCVDIIGDIKNKFWKYKDLFRYYDTLTDTVFMINKECQIKPIGYLGTEKLRMTLEQWNVLFAKRDFYVPNLRNIYEQEEYILFYVNSYNPVLSDNQDYWIIYSKEYGSTKGYKHEKNTPHPIFLNDMDQGVPLHFNFPTSSGDGACQFLSAESIKDYIAEKGPGYFTTEKGKAFKAMGDRLKYDDNDVVVIMKWK